MENSIEEDIKIVENYLASSAINEIESNFFKNGGWETVDLEISKSMQHILSDYKRLQEEFKAIDSECSRLERKEVEMEKIINLMTKYISNITDCPFESEGAYLNCEETCDVITDAECWKQYFINKAKEVK